jgi:hypothetical protein
VRAEPDGADDPEDRRLPAAHRIDERGELFLESGASDPSSRATSIPNASARASMSPATPTDDGVVCAIALSRADQ